MERILRTFLCLVLGVVCMMRKTDGLYQINPANGIITFCEGALATIPLECDNVHDNKKEPMWIRFDQDGKEVWRSTNNTRGISYIGAAMYDLINTEQELHKYFLLIESSLLTAEDDNHKFICIDHEDAKDKDEGVIEDYTNKINQDSTDNVYSYVSLHILPRACCESRCSITNAPPTTTETELLTTKMTTNEISTILSSSSADPSKCVYLVPSERPNNEKNDASSRNMKSESDPDTLDRYPLLTISFVMICIMLFVLLIMAIMVKQMKDELRKLKQDKSEFTNLTCLKESEHLVHENDSVNKQSICDE